MKKIFLAVVLVLASFNFANAHRNAIGIKFGNGGDVSFQRYLSDSERQRAEFNVGVNSFDFDVFTANAMYQLVFGLSAITEGLKWHVGVGAGTAFGDNFDFALNALANAGIEYNFPGFPLQLALDWTPSVLHIVPEFEGGTFNHNSIRFAARLRF